MGCGCRQAAKKPCGCSDCGPYTLDPMGAYRSIDGRPLDVSPTSYKQEMRKDEPLGARLERAWGGDRVHVGSRVRSAPTRAMGAGPTPGTGSMGSGGDGSALGIRGASQRSLLIGARPSVDDPASISLVAIDRVPPPGFTPYGDIPPELLTNRVFGVAVAGDPAGMWPGARGMDVTTANGTIQLVPPLPAPQQVCIVNGFEPNWGLPPASYRGVPLAFDAVLGAYAFNRARAEKMLNPQDVNAPAWLRDVATRYASGLMLQPYRRPDDETWYFRWIPQQRKVSCPTG